MTTREQAASAIPFILKRRSESEREAYLQGYNAGCEHEAKRDKWVSVKERLPDSNHLVLCCAIGSLRPTYGWYHDNIGKWTVNDEPNHNYTKVDRISFVTHWQPLPEPPKEESE